MAHINDRVNVGVGAVLIREFPDGKHVLLGKRINNKHGKGEYSFPGGKPDGGEDPHQACVRELFEETGMRVRKIEALPMWTYDRYEEWDVHTVCLYFLVESTDEPVNMEPEKCAGWHWHHLDRLPEPLYAGVEAALAHA